MVESAPYAISSLPTQNVSSSTAKAQSGNHRSADEMCNLDQLLDVSTKVLGQAIDLLDNSLNSDDQLTVSSAYLPGSTIGDCLLCPHLELTSSNAALAGKHLRHARDHFVLLLECIASPPPHVLSYDKRSRNTPMESSRQAARGAILETIAKLNAIVPQSRLDTPLILNAVTPYDQTFQSTFGRELWFASLHAVHHWSMVRVITGELNIQLEETFGFAPSTLVHQGKDGPLGKAKI
ncbi:hypothetical protein EW146_g1506 [Bondarzewia mesenterica]|uniref:DinB-like domain-containing protein n=1 Tax=Bondarzewia mesenterica TaxID=1095465 RepID=A0A4S4M3K1_9AGAM|nr:hypothetical protein EW146_g1506 [Bondarzewia mesenterica]